MTHPAWTVPALLRWLAAGAPLDPPLSRELGWRDLADRCDALRVLPQAMLRLSAEGHSLADSEARELSYRRLEATIRTGRVLHIGCMALMALRDAGVAAAGFKGIAAVAHLHAGQPTRGIGDVDVLVSPLDANRAIDALMAAGFRPKVAGLDAHEVIAFARTSPGSAGNESISLVTEGDFEVDLHWRLGAFDVDAALASASPARVLGEEMRLVRPGLGLLLSVHHMLRNDFVPDESIRDLLDARDWFRLLSCDLEESAWTERESRRIGLDVACDACAAILADAGLPTGRVAPAPDSPARALADLFRDQVSRPMNTDLVYLCSLRPGLAILRGILTSGRGYLRAMRAVEEAHGEAQLSLHARLGRLIADASTAPRRRWSQLRALAAAKSRAASSRASAHPADTGGA